MVKRDSKGANSSKYERGWENLSEKTEEKSFSRRETARAERESGIYIIKRVVCILLILTLFNYFAFICF
jgi:hypothetical protein